jgi:hypothetical protein
MLYFAAVCLGILIGIAIFIVIEICFYSTSGKRIIVKKKDNVIYGTWSSKVSRFCGKFEAKLPEVVRYDTEFKVDITVQNVLAGTMQGTNFVGIISKNMEITQLNTEDTDKEIVFPRRDQIFRAKNECIGKKSVLKMAGIIAGSKITYMATFGEKMNAIFGLYRLKEAFYTGSDDIGFFEGETRNVITIHDK